MTDSELQTIQIHMIDRPDGHGLRPIDPDRVRDLQGSMEEEHQVPITVRAMPNGRFQLADGQNRLFAAKGLSWTEIKAYVLQCDEHDALIFGVTSNVGRRNLNSIEALEVLSALEAHGHKGTKELAERFGMSKSWLKRTRGLRKLNDEVKSALEKGDICNAAAYEISKVPKNLQSQLLEVAKTGTRAEVRAQVKALRPTPTGAGASHAGARRAGPVRCALKHLVELELALPDDALTADSPRELVTIVKAAQGSLAKLLERLERRPHSNGVGSEAGGVQ